MRSRQHFGARDHALLTANMIYLMLKRNTNHWCFNALDGRTEKKKNITFCPLSITASIEHRWIRCWGITQLPYGEGKNLDKLPNTSTCKQIRVGSLRNVNAFGLREVAGEPGETPRKTQSELPGCVLSQTIYDKSNNLQSICALQARKKGFLFYMKKRQTQGNKKTTTWQVA